MVTTPDSAVTAPGVESLDDGLRIHWDAGQANFYHYFWLRSACFCDACGTSHTGARKLHPGDVPPDIRPISVGLSAERLDIDWPDGHRSAYDLQWLRDFACDDPDRDWQPELWDAALDLERVAHEHGRVAVDEAAMLDFLRDLRDYGLALVRSGEPVGIEAMAGLIGAINTAAYDAVYELKPDPGAHVFGNSQQDIPPHTDEAYLHNPTGILVLYCIRPAREGGDSVLVDGFQIASRLREQHPDSFEALCRYPQAYHRIVPEAGLDHRSRSPALRLDECGQLVGFRFHSRAMAPIDLPGDPARHLHLANFRLNQLALDEANQVRFRLQPGEAVFFDNHRVMHARKAFSDPERHLQICNVAREQFHLKLRLAARACGCYDELRLKLPAGVCG